MKSFRPSRPQRNKLWKILAWSLFFVAFVVMNDFADENHAVPQGVAAGNSSSPQNAAAKLSAPSQLVLALAYPIEVDSKAFDSLSSSKATLENLCDEAKAVKVPLKMENLGTSFLRLLLQTISPLPPHFDGELGKGGDSSGKDVVFWKGYSEYHYLDLSLFDPKTWTATGDQASILGETTRFILSCQYSVSGSQVDVRLAGFDKSVEDANFAWVGSGRVDALQEIASNAALRVDSWIGGRDLGILDILAVPPDSTLSVTSASPAAGPERKGLFLLLGERLYSFTSDPYSIAVKRSGYDDFSDETSVPPGTFSTKKITLTPKAQAGTGAKPLAIDQNLLKWDKKDEYNKRQKAFQGSLSLLLASIPFSVVSVGAYLTYKEADTRSSGFSSEAAVSGAIAGTCLAFSGASVVYMIISLAQLMATTK